MGWTYVDAPKFFDGAESDHFLEEVVPVIALVNPSVSTRQNLSNIVYLSARGLGEPEGPFVHQRVLHVEVLGVVEDGDRLSGLNLLDRRRVLIGDSRGTILDGGHVA